MNTVDENQVTNDTLREMEENAALLERSAKKSAYEMVRKFQATVAKRRRDKLRKDPNRKWKHSDPKYGQKLADAMRRINLEKSATARQID